MNPGADVPWRTDVIKCASRVPNPIKILKTGNGPKRITDLNSLLIHKECGEAAMAMREFKGSGCVPSASQERFQKRSFIAR